MESPRTHGPIHRRTACSAALAALVCAMLPAGPYRSEAQAAEGASGSPGAGGRNGADDRDSLPARLALVYSLSRNGLEIARVIESFERDGNAYRITSEARAVGVAALLARGQGWRRESRGTLGAAGLRPDQFTDQRGTNPLLRARFDWVANRIRFDRPGTDPAEGDGEPLAPGTTDRLSFPYALALRAGRAPGLPATEWEAPMTDGRRVSRYRFTVSGREPLTTPAGSFDTIRVTRVREKDDNATDVWLAAGRGMIPVRILVAEPDGAAFDQVLVQIGGQ
jgi:hypothetical protein